MRPGRALFGLAFASFVTVGCIVATEDEAECRDACNDAHTTCIQTCRDDSCFSACNTSRDACLDDC